MKTFKILSSLFGLFILVSCQAASPAQRSLTVGPVVVATEIVSTPADREVGLMNRDQLAANSGMLFIFPDEQVRIFWMKNTRIPLSIAYISKQGEIKEIHDMAPYSLAPVTSLHTVKYALEVNQGAFQRWGVKPGDHIDVQAVAEFQAR